jgi:hypothetical protein
MTTCKAGGSDISAISGKGYGHGSARHVAGGTGEAYKHVLNTRFKPPNYHSLRIQATVDGATSFYY